MAVASCPIWARRDPTTLSSAAGTSLTSAEGQVSPIRISPLTPREIEILDRVAQGNSNKEIAYGLGISDQTVKNHITSILRKLAVNDRTQAVIYALRHGWIRLTDDTAATMNG